MQKIKITLSLLFLLFYAAQLYPEQDKLKTRVAVIPMINARGDARFNTICATVTDTVELTLKLIGKYRVAREAGIDFYRDKEEAKEYAVENRIDNLIFGKLYLDENEKIVLQMSVYDKLNDSVTITQQEKIEGVIFELFEASDRLVVSLIETFSKVHIGFGDIKLENYGEKGDFNIHLNGEFVGENILEITHILNGIYTLQIKQQRMLGEAVIFEKEVEVQEGNAAVLQFTIPHLLSQEIKVVTEFTTLITRLEYIKEKNTETTQAFAELLKLFADTSYSPQLEEKKSRYHKWQKRYELRLLEWQIEDSFFRAEKADIDRIFTGLISINQQAEKLGIEKIARETVHFLYTVLGLHAVYDFAREQWSSGVDRYLQIERLSERIPADLYYYFNEEKDFVYRVYSDYLLKKREDARKAEKYINERFDKYFGSRLTMVKRFFKDYEKDNGKGFIILSNPIGMKIYMDYEYVGRSPLIIDKFKSEYPNITATDPWLRGPARFKYSITKSTGTNDDRNFAFLLSENQDFIENLLIANPVEQKRKDNYELSWKKYHGAKNYIVQISRQIKGTFEPIEEIFNIKRNSYRLKRELESGNKYAFRVCAVNENGIKSGWSSVLLDQRLLYETDFPHIPGHEWSLKKTSTTPIRKNRFLGDFQIDEIAKLSLADQEQHQAILTSFDLYIIRSWDGSGSGQHPPDIWEFGIAEGPTLFATTFASWHGVRQSFPEQYPWGDHSGLTGAAKSNSLGYKFRDSKADSTYHLEFAAKHSLSDINIAFGGRYGGSNITDESWGLDNIKVYGLTLADYALLNP